MSLTDTFSALPRLGLGLAALGRPGYINLGHGQDLPEDHDPAAMEAQTHEMLDLAWEHGVRYFDVARSYGRGEEFLGNWLRKRTFSSASPTVGSKWGYTYTADWQVQAEHHEIKEHALPVLDRQWQESQANLGTHLDLYQIHSATLESGVLARTEVLHRLAELKAAGMGIGLSLSGPQQAATLGKAMQVSVDGVRLFDAVQATFNLLEQAAQPALRDAAEEGWVIIVKEALANGRLTERNEASDFQSSKQALSEAAQDLKISLDALALAWVLQHPWVHMVLSGAATPAHLNSNVQALDKKLVIPSGLQTSLGRQLKEKSANYWHIRKALAWN